jgi:hypothetical protein
MACKKPEKIAGNTRQACILMQEQVSVSMRGGMSRMNRQWKIKAVDMIGPYQ